MPISIGDSSSGRDSGCRINGNGSEGDVNDETACCRSGEARQAPRPTPPSAGAAAWAAQLEAEAFSCFGRRRIPALP
ncbi:MAG: hypothetical protein ACLR0N_14335 [Bilophila wadsworthia]